MKMEGENEDHCKKQTKNVPASCREDVPIAPKKIGTSEPIQERDDVQSTPFLGKNVSTRPPQPHQDQN